MRIAVVGAGGQGCYLAGMLARAGVDVTLVARGGRVRALREEGLTLQREGEEPIHTVISVADGAIEAARRGVPDVLILAVKTYDLVQATREAAPLTGPETRLLTIQNGLAAPRLVADLYEPARVMAGVSYSRTRLETPTVVTSGGVSGGMEIGALSSGDDATGKVVDRTVATFREAGVDARRRDDVERALWEKLVIICVTGGVMAAARAPLGAVLATETGRRMVRGVISEAVAVATASGVELPEAAARTYHFIESRVGPTATSSMLEDLLAGRPLEIDWLNGEIVRRGDELDIETPVNLAICGALAPHVDGVRRN